MRRCDQTGIVVPICGDRSNDSGMHLFLKIKTNRSIPVNVLDPSKIWGFLYTDSEFRDHSEDVKPFTQMGADGVVVLLSGSRGRSGYGNG